MENIVNHPKASNDLHFLGEKIAEVKLYHLLENVAFCGQQRNPGELSENRWGH